MNPAPNVSKVAPIRKSVVVRKGPEEAFNLFTERMNSWWPRQTHSLFLAECASVVMEPRLGGLVYETSRAGERKDWGTILTWDPPRRFVMNWHPGKHDAATELEMRFTPVPEGTRVDLEHRNWENLGAEAAESRDGYDKGWVAVFEQAFVKGCE